MVTTNPARNVITDGLWDHQAAHVTHHGLDPEWVLLWEPRVGKSLAVTRDIIRWRLEAGTRRVVLSAPKTVCEAVWDPLIRAEANRMAEDYAGTILEVPQVLNLYDGSLALRKQRIRAQKGVSDWVIALVNRDALPELVEELARWVGGSNGGLVLDELHDYKTPSSARARAAFRIGRVCKFRRGLTGTPASEGYEDLYGQWKIVSPETFGTNKTTFLEDYVQFDPHARYPRIIGYRNVEQLKSKAFKIASVVMRKDCFDVPPELDVERTFALPAAVQKVYDTVVDDHILELSSGIEVPVRHTFSRLLQLRQICYGYARWQDMNPEREDDDERTVQWLHDGMLDVVASEVSDIVESGEKIVVFHAYNPERDKLLQALKAYNPLALNGKTPGDARARALKQFNEDENFPVIVAQEDIASLGISMKAANYACFASFGFSRAKHKQARDRIFCPAGEIPGKTLTTIYPLAENSVVIGMRKLQALKADMEDYLLSADRTKTFVNLARGVIA